MPLILLLLGLGAVAYFAESYYKESGYSDVLHAGRVYLLIVRNQQPAAPVPVIQAWAAVSQGFSNPEGASFVSGALAADAQTYSFIFDHTGQTGDTFTWGSPYALQDQGSVLLSRFVPHGTETGPAEGVV